MTKLNFIQAFNAEKRERNLFWRQPWSLWSLLEVRTSTWVTFWGEHLCAKVGCCSSTGTKINVFCIGELAIKNIKKIIKQKNKQTKTHWFVGLKTIWNVFLKTELQNQYLWFFFSSSFWTFRPHQGCLVHILCFSPLPWGLQIKFENKTSKSN